jgi:phytoene desaturase
MGMKKKKIIVVGAGPGGLTAAMLLAHNGHEVTVLEKTGRPGGRSATIEFGEYVFDTGPTFLMMKYKLEEVFEKAGRKAEDYLEFQNLDPMYDLRFGDKALTMYHDKCKLEEEIERVFPGEGKGLRAFMEKEEKRFAGIEPLFEKSNNNFVDVLSPTFLKAIPSFSVGRTLFDVMGDYFDSEELRLAFTFQSKYIGMSPWECPGAFGLIPYVEHAFGVYHVTGGLSRISEAMAQVVEEDGGEIHYGTTVQELMMEGNEVKGVKLENGEEMRADEVVLNADFAYAMQELIPKGATQKYTPEKLAKKPLSASIFMLYLGVAEQYDLAHHTIVFADEYRKNVEEIFGNTLTEEDFSFYVRDTSKTDPGTAPKGKSALYVLVPVANNRAKIDWENKAPVIRERVLEMMEDKLGMKGIREKIEQEKMITPDQWERDYNVYEGAVFNLSHHLRQMLWFRPHNKHEEFDHLYLVGGGTHPGSGLPTIYQSGIIAAELIE